MRRTSVGEASGRGSTLPPTRRPPTTTIPRLEPSLPSTARGGRSARGIRPTADRTTAAGANRDCRVGLAPCHLLRQLLGRPVLSATRFPSDHEEKATLAVPGRDLPELAHEVVESSADRRGVEQTGSLEAVIARQHRRNAPHELETAVLEPLHDLADGVLRLVRVPVLVGEPGASLLAPQVPEVRIEPLTAPTRDPEYPPPEVGHQPPALVVEPYHDVSAWA